jgi:hypothetical protein
MAMGFYQQNLDEISYKVRVDMDDMEFTLWVTGRRVANSFTAACSLSATQVHAAL